MSKVIAIANQKGGTGKTTTCINLGHGLAMKGKRVLLIDFDSQANLTTCMGFDPESLEVTIGSVLTDRSNHNECPPASTYIISTPTQYTGSIDVIPADINLFALESLLSSGQVIKREEQLRRFINSIDISYDYILIDCMPSLNIMTTNALTAADEVLIPMQAQYLSGKGREQLFQSIDLIREEELNPNLKLNGILFTMVDSRANHPKKLMQETKMCGSDCFVYDTVIPASIKVAEAQEQCKSILSCPSNPVAKGYQAFIEEFIAREGD